MKYQVTVTGVKPWQNKITGAFAMNTLVMGAGKGECGVCVPTEQEVVEAKESVDAMHL